MHLIFCFSSPLRTFRLLLCPCPNMYVFKKQNLFITPPDIPSPSMSMPVHCSISSISFFPNEAYIQKKYELNSHTAHTHVQHVFYMHKTFMHKTIMYIYYNCE
jgi:hypothetical protein